MLFVWLVFWPVRLTQSNCDYLLDRTSTLFASSVFILWPTKKPERTFLLHPALRQDSFTVLQKLVGCETAPGGSTLWSSVVNTCGVLILPQLHGWVPGQHQDGSTKGPESVDSASPPLGLCLVWTLWPCRGYFECQEQIHHEGFYRVPEFLPDLNEPVISCRTLGTFFFPSFFQTLKILPQTGWWVLQLSGLLGGGSGGRGEHIKHTTAATVLSGWGPSCEAEQHRIWELSTF